MSSPSAAAAPLAVKPLALSHGLSHSLLILLLCIFGKIVVYNYQCVFLIDLLMVQRENRADAKSIAVGREPTTVCSVWLYSFLQLQLQHSMLAYTAYGPSIPGNWKPISVHLNRFMLPSIGPRMSRLQYMQVSYLSMKKLKVSTLGFMSWYLKHTGVFDSISELFIS